MKRLAFIRELRKLARKNGVCFAYQADAGKGGHARVRFGDKSTIIQSGELSPLKVERIKKQLGIE